MHILCTLLYAKKKVQYPVSLYAHAHVVASAGWGAGARAWLNAYSMLQVAANVHPHAKKDE